MYGYVARRLLATLPVLAVVAVVVFGILHLGPGDPAALIAGDQATPQQTAEIRGKLGLDRPLYQQFAAWVARLLRGDLGISIFSNQPVTHLLAQRLEPTLSLTVATTIVMVLLAVLGFSLPVFVVAYLLIYALAMRLDLFPIQGYTPMRDGLARWAWHLVLPS